MKRLCICRKTCPLKVYNGRGGFIPPEVFLFCLFSTSSHPPATWQEYRVRAFDFDFRTTYDLFVCDTTKTNEHRPRTQRVQVDRGPGKYIL